MASFADQVNKPVESKNLPKPKFQLRDFERHLVAGITRAKEVADNNLRSRELKKWEEWYRDHLEAMYSFVQEVFPDLCYADFVSVAFDCSQTEYDIRRFKFYKPCF